MILRTFWSTALLMIMLAIPTVPLASAADVCGDVPDFVDSDIAAVRSHTPMYTNPILRINDLLGYVCGSGGSGGGSGSGSRVIVTGAGSVTATFVSRSAWDSSSVTLDSPTPGSVFPSCADGSGSTFLGIFFSGEELVFGLHDLSTGYSYETGPGSRNLDGGVHAIVTSTSSGVRVSFEDGYGLGDADFNDCVFDVTGPVEASS